MFCRNLKLNFLLCFLFALPLVLGCENDGNRKIKLADSDSELSPNVQKGASVLQVAAEKQRTITILYFQNETGDPNLDWLRRGLTDMLVADLAQSPYLHVLSTKRLHDIAEHHGKSPESLDLETAMDIAREANTEIMISGRLYKEAQTLNLEIDLHNVQMRKMLRRESVSGTGLESLLILVDKISGRLRGVLRDDFEVRSEFQLADMTSSLEAFKCYSEALENMEKYLFPDADACLSKALHYDSTFAAAYLRQYLTKQLMGESQSATAALQKARGYADKLSEPDEMLLRFWEAANSNDIEQIMASMEELLKFEPTDLETRVQLAEMLRKFDMPDRAIKEYEKIIELDPKRKMAYNYLGYLYAERGDFATGLKYIDQYIQLAKDEPNPYDSKGELLMMAGRLEEAVVQLKTALEKRPNFYYSDMRLSHIYSELGNLKKATEYADRWFEHAPSPMTKADALVKKAEVYWRFDQITEAKKSLELAKQTWPALVDIPLIGGEMYRSIGDSVTSRQLYQAFYEKNKKVFFNNDPDVGELLTILRFCIEADSPAEKLIPFIRKLKSEEERPYNRHMLSAYLGLLYLRQGDYEKANACLKNQDKEFVDLYIKFPNTARSMAWKYRIEAITLEPKQEQPDLSRVNDLLEASQKAGRDDLKTMMRFLRTTYFGKYGLRKELLAEYQAMGTAPEENWLVLGPLPNRSGFHRAFPPESKFEPAGSYKIGAKTFSWEPASDGVYDGFVDLRAVFGHSAWSVGYGVINVNSPDKRKVQLRLAANGACKLWLNNKLVWQVYRIKDVPIDHDVITVVLRPGDNKLMIKLANEHGDWGYYFRVTDENGRGFSDITFRRPAADDQAVAMID